MAVGNGRCVIWGSPNFLGSGYCVVTAPGSLAGAGPEKVQSELVSETWRSDSIQPARTRLYFSMNTERPIGAIGKINLNLRATDKWRIAIRQSALSLPFEGDYATPDLIVTQTNLTGSITAIQSDPFAAATYLTPTVNANPIALQCRLTVPPASLKVGAGLQVVQIRLQKTGSAPVGLPYTVKLYGSTGSFIRAESGVALSPSGFGNPFQINFQFNASEIITSTIQIRFEYAGGSESFKIGGIRWYAAGGCDYDTGLMDCFPPSMADVFADADIEGMPYPLNVHHIFDVANSAGIPGGFAEDAISVSQMTGRMMIEFRSTSNPDGYVEVGIAAGGRMWRPRVNFQENVVLRVVDPTEVVELEGAGILFRPGTPYRQTEFTLAKQPREDMMIQAFRRMDRIGGKKQALCVALFPDDTEMSEHAFFRGFQAEMGPVSFTKGVSSETGQGLTSKSFTIRELL